MNFKHYCLAAALVLYCGFAQAANETIFDKKIVGISTYKNSALIVFSPASTHSQEGCTESKTRAMIDFEKDDYSRQEMYSLVLAAAAAGKTVNIAVNGCKGSHPDIYRVDVKFE